MAPEDNFPTGDFELFPDAASMSDEDLERLMSGNLEAPESKVSYEDLEPGTRLQGIVVEVQSQDVLVELNGKTFGVIDREEYVDEEPPRPGTTIDVELVQYDRTRDLCVLTTRAVRTEVAWDEVRVGQLLEGTVTETNKGGLTLDIKGLRAFLPISQIDLDRVEADALQKYVGRKMHCQVVQYDRSEKNLVVSRRAILEKNREEEKRRSLEALSPGDVIKGRVTRITGHGAFIDLGGVDGLLHASKIREQLKSKPGEESLKVGDIIEVEVHQVDRERGRVGLDFRAVDENAWETVIQDYREGDEVAGWLSRFDGDWAILSLERGLEARIHRNELAGGDLSVGSILRGAITAIDHEKQEIEVRPIL